MTTKAPYSLKDIVFYFLRLGTIGFGGPVALVGYMQRDLVENRKWITENEYKEGLALSQLAPGPLAAQLGIYLGFVHYGLLGATLTGFAFVIPSFVMVLLIGMAYTNYGGLPWMQAIFYGVGAAVIGIISLSAYKLTQKSVSAINLKAIREHWILWLLYCIAGLITFLTHTENVFVFIAAGLLCMLIKAPPGWVKKPRAATIFLGMGFWQFDLPVLGKIALFFTKAGSFLFGSGWRSYHFFTVELWCKITGSPNTSSLMP